MKASNGIMVIMVIVVNYGCVVKNPRLNILCIGIL